MADVQPDALELAAREVRALGAEVLARRTDVSRAAEVEALAESTLHGFGVPSFVFNNAGVGESGSLAEVPIERVCRTFEVNVFATLELTQIVLRGMNEQERSRAFDRFWRSERNAADGTGLGLAIVRRLVEADNGTITLHEAPGGGLDVQIRYPGATLTDEPNGTHRPGGPAPVTGSPAQ